MVEFDPNKLSYKKLVEYFFRHIDPTVKNAQFCDHGSQYRSAIFYLSDQQKKIAMEYKKELEQKFPTVYTEIAPSTSFYPAEEYHQNYYKKILYVISIIAIVVAGIPEFKRFGVIKNKRITLNHEP